MRRLTFTNGVKYSHGGEPIHLTALAVERMLQSNLDATSIVVSVALKHSKSRSV